MLADASQWHLSGGGDGLIARPAVPRLSSQSHITPSFLPPGPLGPGLATGSISSRPGELHAKSPCTEYGGL